MNLKQITENDQLDLKKIYFDSIISIDEASNFSSFELSFKKLKKIRKKNNKLAIKLFFINPN